MIQEDRWMALDVGHKRIGVAISDPLKLLARPLLCLSRTTLDEDVRLIRELVQDYQVSCLILGLPRHLDGRASSITGIIQLLAHELSQQSSLDIKWADERLSSKEAEELMAELNLPIKKRRRMRDAYAAAVILRRFIEEGASQP